MLPRWAEKVVSGLADALPAFASFLERAVAASPAGDPVADQIRRILPEQGASERALRELEQREGGR